MTLVLAAWSLLAASPVLADEFVVGVVAEPAAGTGTMPPFMEGFQLAVNQSPDVSHPPDTEGGDHLGAMDVVMVFVDASVTEAKLLAATIELTDVSRVPIIVVDVGPEVLASIVGPVTDSGAMLISMSDTGGRYFPETPLLFLAGENEGTLRLLSDREPTFEAVFLAAYGRSPTAVAARGYLAGRLVDISVGATDRDPFDSDTLAVALAAATQTIPTPPEPAGERDTSVEPVVPSQEAATSTSIAAQQIDESASSYSLLWFGVAALTAIVAASVLLMRRRRVQANKREY